MVHSYIERREKQDCLIAEIDLSKCLTARGMYSEFDEAFQFPTSKNAGSLDVLLDFMRDLGWQKCKNTKIHLTNAEKARKANHTKVLEVQRLLELICDYWTRENTLHKQHTIQFSILGS